VIVLLDNYDSFGHNLARYLRQLGQRVIVLRNDATDVRGLLDRQPTHIVISPGPCTPAEAGIAVDLVRELPPGTPLLGVCLGHQCIGVAFGARLLRVDPVHGKVSTVQHDGRGVFEGLPSSIRVTRYHSLAIDPGSLPEELVPCAWTSHGDILMGVRHRSLPIWGVQFHPEAVLTEHGHALLRNFVALGRREPAPGLAAGLPSP
jgi:anthranilate synthase component 2